MSFFDRLRTIVGGRPPLRLHNTLTGRDDVFELPPAARRVRMYNCGPTVYGVQHIGNLSMFVFTDVLRRALEYNGFEVKQVINITDVGHLSSDADSGEDKMTLGLRRAGMELTLANMRALAEKYTAMFLDDLKKLNIATEAVQFPRASDYIPAQIAMIKTLEEKGYAYKTGDGVYFDTVRFPAYGQLGGINLEGLKEGARVAQTSGKRHPTDFALWKLDANLGWDSPWGKGFPGWHIECSAMIRALLGEKIDIHTGGIEHIPIHHNNEIAQSEAATGKRPLSRFWLHRAHIQIEGGKIAKSEGNVVYLSDIEKRWFNPLSLRYLFLGAHYRTPSNFSWEALEAAQNALIRIAAQVRIQGSNDDVVPNKYKKRFIDRINDDLDTPGALAVMWEMIKDKNLSSLEVRAGILDFDRVLGLNPSSILPRGPANTISKYDLPNNLLELFEEREIAREHKDFEAADRIREQFAKQDYTLTDVAGGTVIERNEVSFPKQS